MNPDVAIDRSRWPGWLAVVLPPAAWSIMLSIHLLLVDFACTRGVRTPMLMVSIACAIPVVVGGLLCALALRRGLEEGSSSRSTRLLLQIGAWEAPLFLLLIVASTVPVYLLSPCPT